MESTAIQMTKSTAKVNVALTAEFESKVSDIRIDTTTIMTVLKYAMEVVEVTEMPGSEKKSAVIHLVRKIIVAEVEEEETKALILAMIDMGAFSSIIDFTVAATKGELNVNAAMKAGEGIVAVWLPKVKECVRNCLSKKE